ncbi:MAG: hypothetical protein Q8P98_10355 [Candidatus Rokubacteria bacterium]|nr:hypothetical protein [Candidatus Rokubacteria bacterium]
MTTQSIGLTKAEGRELCRATRITHWYHEDEVCWIAECDVCDHAHPKGGFFGTCRK